MDLQNTIHNYHQILHYSIIYFSNQQEMFVGQKYPKYYDRDNKMNIAFALVSCISLLRSGFKTSFSREFPFG